MAARQRILALNQRHRSRSQATYTNAYTRQHLNPLDVLSDRAIQTKYRLPRAEIQRLIELVSPHIRRPTRRNIALSPEVQLLAALHFYVTGSFQEVVGRGTGLSGPSVSRSVAAVTPVLLRHARRHIKMPATPEEICRVHQGFQNMAGIPRVIGVVDGTMIRLHCTPEEGDPSWICRKNFPAINTQVVVDHDGLITDIVAKWPGASHDAFVWENSAVGERAASGAFGSCVFLGDGSYPLRTYLLTPVAEPASPDEERFNESHANARRHIQRVFGRWKARFSCVHRRSGGLRLSPLKTCQVIVVTAMLHNIAVRAGLPDVDDEGDDDEEEDDGDDDPPPPPPLPSEPQAALHQAGARVRQEIIDVF